MAAVVDLCMVTKAVGFPFTCGRTLPTAVFENAALMTYIVPSLPVGIFSIRKFVFFFPISSSLSSSSHSNGIDYSTGFRGHGSR
jgi:hypothetical protein